MKRVDRRRILFVAENVTMAQVVRLVVLARALDPQRYAIHFACSDFDPLVFDGWAVARHDLYTLPKEAVFGALASGKRLYEKATLARYIRADVELMQRVEPQLVVGDLRWSLTVSAPLCRVPHAALINAYWSPFAERSRFPVPDHPIIGILGESMTEKYFPLAIPRVFSHFVAPLNALRRQHGLPGLGGLLEVLTAANFTLYADDPKLIPTPGAPATHRHIGPVLWSPRIHMPAAWADSGDKPLIYVTLGSSGDTKVLPAVLGALARLPVVAVLSTAGRPQPSSLPPNVRAFQFVPGDEAARRAAVVVSNGGSTTSYQALAEGTPVLGLPSNFDQYLAMEAVEKAGAGRLLKARTATADSIVEAIQELLTQPTFRTAARHWQVSFASHDAATNFSRFVEHLLEASFAA